MRFFNDLGLGFSSHVKAVGFIAKHNLWLYFLWPLLIAIGLWVGGFASTFYLGDLLTDKILSWSNLDSEWEIGWLEYIRPVLTFLVSGILKILLFVLFASMLKYIVLIICSPILALLSERIDEILTGTKIPFDFAQLLKDMLRGILVTLRNMMLELLIWIACVCFAAIPLLGWVLGWLTIPFRYIIGCYFLGFS
ncbi:MAG: EI24 domain-containing protein, partial [Bacteroidia bacterium]